MSSNQDLAQTPLRQQGIKIAKQITAQAKVVAGLALVAAVVAATFFFGVYYGNRFRDDDHAEEYFSTDNVGGCIIGLNCGCIGPRCPYRILRP
jgi:hypothetical protein